MTRLLPPEHPHKVLVILTTGITLTASDQAIGSADRANADLCSLDESIAQIATATSPTTTSPEPSASLVLQSQASDSAERGTTDPISLQLDGIDRPSRNQYLPWIRYQMNDNRPKLTDSTPTTSTAANNVDRAVFESYVNINIQTTVREIYLKNRTESAADKIILTVFVILNLFLIGVCLALASKSPWAYLALFATIPLTALYANISPEAKRAKIRLKEQERTVSVLTNYVVATWSNSGKPMNGRTASQAVHFLLPINDAMTPDQLNALREHVIQSHKYT